MSTVIDFNLFSEYDEPYEPEYYSAQSMPEKDTQEKSESTVE